MATLLSDALHTTKGDSGRWLVLTSCFFAKMFAQGIRKCLGVLLPTLQRQFDSEIWLLGSIVAMVCAIGDFLGPIIGAFARRFSCRAMAMTGGALMCLGMALASQMDNVFHLATCLMIFCGPGLGLINDTPFAILAMYFNRNYGLANAFAFLGSSAALILFSTLTQILNELYGWSGALLLLASIFFHMTMFGALLKAPENETSEAFGYGSIRELPNSDDKQNKTTSSTCTKCFSATLDSLHLPIFKEPILYMIIVVTSTVRFTHMGWVIYLVPNVENKGIAPLYATLVAAVGGVGDAVGKIIPVVILWKELLNSSALWICGMTILSVSLILDFTVTSSFTGMLVLGFVQGLGLGISHSLNNVVLQDVFGTERLVNVMGWTRFFSGMARVLGGFVVGWIYSSSGHYSYGFVTLGCVQGLGMLVLVIGRRFITEQKNTR
ncbi:monocarboxylate transporter 13-like [Amphiura filiformis]|uniref:monocarboxylate transporter 13-like n=1 Tax=Amphiura filiformis TaxID=82378 RepID=UPI003B21D00C